MSNQLIITTDLEDDHWLITAELSDSTTLPKEIFIYENTGTIILGEFYGTCSVSDLVKLQVYSSSTAIPIFGNKFLRHTQAKIKVALADDVSQVVSTLVAGVKSFKIGYLSQASKTTVYNL